MSLNFSAKKSVACVEYIWIFYLLDKKEKKGIMIKEVKGMIIKKEKEMMMTEKHQEIEDETSYIR